MYGSFSNRPLLLSTCDCMQFNVCQQTEASPSQSCLLILNSEKIFFSRVTIDIK